MLPEFPGTNLLNSLEQVLSKTAELQSYKIDFNFIHGENRALKHQLIELALERDSAVFTAEKTTELLNRVLAEKDTLAETSTKDREDFEKHLRKMGGHDTRSSSLRNSSSSRALINQRQVDQGSGGAGTFHIAHWYILDQCTFHIAHWSSAPRCGGPRLSSTAVHFCPLHMLTFSFS